MSLRLLRLWTGPLPIQELFPVDRKINPLLHWFIHPVKRHIAKYYLWFLQTFFGLKVIALTGSTGKTTTSNMLYSVLSLSGPTIKTADSVTTTYNIPTTILNCTIKTKYLILEMGVEYPGDMNFYCWLAKPDVSTVLNITSVHSSFLGTLEQIKNEKYKLQKYSKVFITPENYPKIISSKITKYLITEIKCQMPNDQLLIKLPLLGVHFSQNTSAVIGICNRLEIPTDLIKSGLESVTGPKHRMNIIKLFNGNIILDDSYNANPLSVTESLNTLAQVSAAQGMVPVFVFAQMNELGSYEKSSHEQIGRLVKKLGIKQFYCLGPATKYSIKSAGFGQYSENLDSIAIVLKKIISHKSYFVILVKGSRSWQLDKLVTNMIL